ncbi:EVE domain-containing protein [Methanoculleus bourgensis]|mgnify:FL=1|uniref:EVE domain-containing protein n=1 Tax=Methanoculleus bourgensis TaxID=83986 RepID=UPI0022EDE446|nr:EVE domain-containing protein [Methanoculleus bourgensis]GLI46240.1 EVE domain-containing protein [Methanoculleus bourgensis]
MTHWIASSNRDNAKILDAKHIWGVPKRNKSLMHRVKPGDTILVYVRQEKEGDTILPSAITGAYEVVSEPYEDPKPLFVTPEHMGDEVFPFRMKVKSVAVFAEPLEFKPLIPDLTFITNKKMWSGHLRQAMREIPAEDYHLILRRAGVEATDA